MPSSDSVPLAALQLGKRKDSGASFPWCGIRLTARQRSPGKITLFWNNVGHLGLTETRQTITTWGSPTQALAESTDKALADMAAWRRATCATARGKSRWGKANAAKIETQSRVCLRVMWIPRAEKEMSTSISQMRVDNDLHPMRSARWASKTRNIGLCGVVRVRLHSDLSKSLRRLTPDEHHGHKTGRSRPVWTYSKNATLSVAFPWLTLDTRIRTRC